MFSIIADTDAKLLTKIGTNIFVVAAPAGEGEAAVDQFYQNGAFLVLNAAGLGACGGEESARAFRKASNDQVI